MKLRVIQLFVLLFVFVGLPAKAEKSVFDTPEVAQAIADIYAIEYADFAAHTAKISDPALQKYVVEYQALMNYAVANNHKNFEAYLSASDAALDAIGKHPKASILECNIFFHRCMAEMSKGNLITGGMRFWKSYRAFLRGEKEYPDNDAQLMMRAVFNILLSQIPQKWQGIAGVVGFGKGDLALGFKQLEEYRCKMLHNEGLAQEALLLTFANIFLSHEQRISDTVAAEIKKSQSPIIVFTYMLSLGRQQKGEEAFALANSLSDKMIKKFPLLMHQKAKVAIRRLEPEKCIDYANKFFVSYQGVNCKSDALLLKAYSELLLGRRAEALASARSCSKMGADNDVDHRTQADAERFADEEVPLLRSRFRCEYGNYEQSIHELDGFEPKGSKQIEYNFRLARAHEKLGHKREALVFYDKAIDLAARDDRYFGPYSAVYVADIYLAKGNKEKARAYLEKAKKLNNGEYSKEITQRIQITTELAK